MNEVAHGYRCFPLGYPTSMGPALVVMARPVTLRVDRPQGGLTRGGRSGRVASMKHRHDVSEAELTRALQRALLHAIEECGAERANRPPSLPIFGEPFRRCFAAGNAIQALVKVFRDKLEAALARRDVAGHA